VASPAAIRYRAFLSYSHRDQAWADWLHRALETYRIDRELIGRETGVGVVPKTLGPIFRDREDFSAGHSLTAKTLAALEASHFLLVICSPHAAQSRYVDDEIRRFKAMGRAHRIIPLIVDGEPGDAARECFPPALRFKVSSDGILSDEPEEPIAADARPKGDGKTIAAQKIVAALLGLELDDIVRRAERARRRRNRTWAALAGVFLLLGVIATASAAYAWQQLRTNERLLDTTLRRATEIVKTAVDSAQRYHVPKAATLEFLRRAEGLFGDMAELGKPTPELHYRKALMQIEFARIYSRLGDTRASRAQAESAIDLLVALSKSKLDNPELQLAHADARMQLGHTLDLQGHLEEAALQFELSLFVAQRHVESRPANNVALATASLSAERIGDIRRKQGRFREAAVAYQANLQLATRLTVRLPEAIEKMSTIVVELGDRDYGLVQMRRALTLVQTMEKLSPQNRDFFLPVISSAHEAVGRMLLAQGKLSDAAREFQASIAIAERLANRDHSDKYLRHKEIAVGALIEEVQIAKGNSQGAFESSKARLAELQRLVRDDPHNIYLQINLALAHELIADAHVALGRFDAAMASYRESHAMWERISAKSPDNIDSSLSLLWSHSRLALLGDSPAARLQQIVATLRHLKEQNRIAPSLARWLSVAEEGLGTVTPMTERWQADLIDVLWRAAPLTQNPVRQCALLVAMLRKLQQEDRLPPEPSDRISKAEAELAAFRRQ
jgi:tetratricopeptide (TPR) repeat protein